VCKNVCRNVRKVHLDRSKRERAAPKAVTDKNWQKQLDADRNFYSPFIVTQSLRDREKGLTKVNGEKD